jgi:ferredoxin
MNWAELEDRAASDGLILMGTLHDAGGTVALLGAGPDMWQCFLQSAEYRDGGPHPLDRWSKRVVGALCKPYCASAVYPSDGPPYAPFIAWALQSGRFWQSPTGMLVHARAGLMISLRGAIRLPDEHALSRETQPNPCETCEDQPCVGSCPVEALSAHAPYDVAGCKAHITSPVGRECLNRGCRARRACPVSRSFGRDAQQSAFHMRAFVAG